MVAEGETAGAGPVVDHIQVYTCWDTVHTAEMHRHGFDEIIVPSPGIQHSPEDEWYVGELVHRVAEGMVGLGPEAGVGSGFLCGGWALKCVRGEPGSFACEGHIATDGFLTLYEYDAGSRCYVPGVRTASSIFAAQMRFCESRGLAYMETGFYEEAAVSRRLLDSYVDGEQPPVCGMRVCLRGVDSWEANKSRSVWVLDWDGEYEEDYVRVRFHQVKRFFPEAIERMAIPAGYRFDADGTVYPC